MPQQQPSTSMTGSIVSAYRRQFDALQDLTAASLSGFERAQQSCLEMCRHAVGQQIDVASRINDRATETLLDPEQARPALEGLMRAQREMVQALTETQRRMIDSITPNGEDQSNIASTFADVSRQQIDQWQRFMQQFFQMARDQTETLTREAERMQREMQQSGHQLSQSAQRAGEGTADAARRAAENTSQQQRRTAETQRRATESA